MRAVAKAAGLWVFGRTPGGAALYRRATRKWLGTQRTHVDKLARVAPGYFEVWRGAGIDLERANIAILEPGVTSFWPMACRLVTGGKSHHLQLESAFDPQYITRSAGGVVASLGERFPSRKSEIDRLRWAHTVSEVLDACGAIEHREVDPGHLPLEDASVDVIQSGGVLEHFKQHNVGAFFKECKRILRPGGVCSHVFDHRDHLYHADKSIEPMNHLRYSEPVYWLLFGHRLTYHNRLLPAQVHAIICESGLEQIAMRRLTLPGGKYVSDEEVTGGLLGCSKLHKRYRQASPIDLRTAACHYVFKKT
ncbi:MAG: class I SAM-dependent methyltransferase [Armatimonadetes bacterium]|nr:class I SAM-dependent methyltransferase [Armatimonadota bacterium]